ncbi:MAG: DNA-processing protein DprA [Clostridiales bacterium]|nr:DNA-processing protein DprA [Clostridiales bacterium]
MKNALTSRKICLWLSTLESLTAVKIGFLLRAFKDPRRLWTASSAEIARIPGISEKNALDITSSRDIEELEAYAASLEKLGIYYVTIFDDDYPSLLKNIYDPPLTLYVKGRLPGDDARLVAVIGSRACTEYGRSAAAKLSGDLAQCGIVIVSGMARGIDSYAHRAAVDNGGTTVAILGCGLDVCYPKENARLMEDIARNGCVISEYPLGTPPAAHHFPLRNRIISGLCQAVVVVEASDKSGTLITSRLALEQGRDVLAVPGNITSETSTGVNGLIKDGAGLVTNYRDVLLAIGCDVPYNSAQNEDLGLALSEKLIYDCIGFESISPDEIAAASKLDLEEIVYNLLLLEVRGFIRRAPGGRYVRIR